MRRESNVIQLITWRKTHVVTDLIEIGGVCALMGSRTPSADDVYLIRLMCVVACQIDWATNVVSNRPSVTQFGLELGDLSEDSLLFAGQSSVDQADAAAVAEVIFPVR